jgi:hypothetical protein
MRRYWCLRRTMKLSRYSMAGGGSNARFNPPVHDAYLPRSCRKRLVYWSAVLPLTELQVGEA